MRIDWWTLALQTVNALVLIWLLGRFLFRPVADMIAARKAAANSLLDEAEAARAAALASREEAKAALAEIVRTRGSALEAAAADAKEQKQILLDAAQAEVERLRANARADMDREATLQRQAQMARASELAVDIARRLVDRLPPADRVAGFIDGLAAAARALPPETRADFDAAGDATRLKAPRALTPAEEERCRQALEEAFGHPVVFDIEIDPAIIAGLELENRHTAIRNSLRADLELIASEIGKNDSNR